MVASNLEPTPPNNDFTPILADRFGCFQTWRQHLPTFISVFASRWPFVYFLSCSLPSSRRLAQMRTRLILYSGSRNPRHRQPVEAHNQRPRVPKRRAGHASERRGKRETKRQNTLARQSGKDVLMTHDVVNFGVVLSLSRKPSFGKGTSKRSNADRRLQRHAGRRPGSRLHGGVGLHGNAGDGHGRCPSVLHDGVANRHRCTVSFGRAASERAAT